MTCAAMIEAAPQETGPWQLGKAPGEGAFCAVIDAEAAGRFGQDLPAVGVGRRITLENPRLELSVGKIHLASARFAVQAVRSGGETGYIGVAGESIVPRVQVAEVRAEVSRWGLAVGAGLIDDPYVISTQGAWARRVIAPVMAEETGWMDRSDLGAWISWTAPSGWGSVRVVGTTGEGLAQRERNNGKDLAVLATLRPSAAWGGVPGAQGAAADRPVVEVGLYGRDGAKGLSAARNHRLGGRLSVAHPWVVVGVEAIVGYGAFGDASVLPRAFSGWARTGPRSPVLGWARIDALDGDASRDDAGATRIRAGAGAALPRKKSSLDAPWLHLAAGVDHLRLESNAASVPGFGALGTGTTLFVQLGGRFVGGFELDPLETTP